MTGPVAPILIVSAISLSIIPIAQAQTQGDPSEMTIEHDVAVTTRAGFDVMINVYRPNRSGQFPVLISMGPYGKDDLPAEYDGIFGAGQIVVSQYAAFETPDPEYWVHNGYVVIAADSPGSNRSGGDLDIFGAIEANAFYDVIEWAGVQPWSNGNVGLNGVSYFAMSQWYVAALNPPHLKAIMPAEGLTDMYRDVMGHGGIPAVFAEPWMEHRVRRVRNPEAMLVRDPAVGALEHPLDGAYWQAWVPELTKISVPAYVIASWPDHGLHTRGTLIGFERISSEQKWLEVHGRKKWEYYYSRESLERQRRFFDYFLKGIENGMDRDPTVRYERRNRFYDGDFLWAENWPLPNTEALQLYLQPEGGLALDPSATEETLRYDSEFGQLAFHHEFEEDTEITGGAWLMLWVEPDAADDMDLFVGLGKLDRYGSEVLMPGYNDVENGHLASGWLRVSHREIDEGRSTEFRPYLRHEQQQKLSPGEIVPVDIEILPSSTYFVAGQSLVLRVQGVELEGAGDIEHEGPVNSGNHIVHVGGAYGSSLLLPVVQ